MTDNDYMYYRNFISELEEINNKYKIALTVIERKVESSIDGTQIDDKQLEILLNNSSFDLLNGATATYSKLVEIKNNLEDQIEMFKNRTVGIGREAFVEFQKIENLNENTVKKIKEWQAKQKAQLGQELVDHVLKNPSSCKKDGDNYKVTMNSKIYEINPSMMEVYNFIKLLSDGYSRIEEKFMDKVVTNKELEINKAVLEINKEAKLQAKLGKVDFSKFELLKNTGVILKKAIDNINVKPEVEEVKKEEVKKETIVEKEEILEPVEIKGSKAVKIPTGFIGKLKNKLTKEWESNSVLGLLKYMRSNSFNRVRKKINKNQEKNHKEINKEVTVNKTLEEDLKTKTPDEIGKEVIKKFQDSVNNNILEKEEKTVLKQELEEKLENPKLIEDKVNQKLSALPVVDEPVVELITTEAMENVINDNKDTKSLEPVEIEKVDIKALSPEEFIAYYNAKKANVEQELKEIEELEQRKEEIDRLKEQRATQNPDVFTRNFAVRHAKELDGKEQASYMKKYNIKKEEMEAGKGLYQDQIKEIRSEKRTEQNAIKKQKIAEEKEAKRLEEEARISAEEYELDKQDFLSFAALHDSMPVLSAMLKDNKYGFTLQDVENYKEEIERQNTNSSKSK